MTVPISLMLLLVCPFVIHETLLTMPMMPSPMMMRVSNCSRSTRCVYLKLMMRQIIAMRNMQRPSVIEITTLNVPVSFASLIKSAKLTRESAPPNV